MNWKNARSNVYILILILKTKRSAKKIKVVVEKTSDFGFYSVVKYLNLNTI